MTLETQIIKYLAERNTATRTQLQIATGFPVTPFVKFRKALQSVLDDKLIEHYRERRYDQEMGGVYMWIGYRITEAGVEL